MNLKTSVLAFLIVVVATQPMAQEIPKTNLLKTNVFNLFIIPSLHFERELNPHNGLQFNFHRGGITFISRQDWLNTSIDWRHYYKPNEIHSLTGFYTALGVQLNHQYNGYSADTSNYNPTGETIFGIQGKIGFQKNIKNSRWFWDVGIGLAQGIYHIQNKQNETSTELRFNFTFAYRL
jgi:hypothetical protein